MPKEDDSKTLAEGVDAEVPPSPVATLTIIFSPVAQLTQVEGFPVDCKRTVAGAIHVRPGATRTVSEGEAEHLKKCGVAFTVARAPKPVEAPALAEPSASALPAGPVPLSSPTPMPSAPPKGTGAISKGSKDVESFDKK